MSKQLKRLDADVVIVGSGPGGATVAKELSQRGKKVILLEKGGYHKRFMGTLIAAANIFENHGKTPTMEGDIMFSASGVGGTTLVFTGSAFEPLHKEWLEHGIDIIKEAREARQECWVNKVPDSLITPAAKRMMTSAQELGYPWEVLDKFVDPEKCKAGCDKCSLGCPKGAKWTAEEYVRQAVANGATLLTHVAVRDVMVEGGIAGGVRARGSDGQEYEVHAKVVVCAAGGMNSARILRRSGIYDAGRWFAADPSAIVVGYLKEGTGMHGDHLMGVGWKDHENGVTYASAMSTDYSQLLANVANSEHKLRDIQNIRRRKKAMGIMVKISDETTGRVFLEEGKVSKVFTDQDNFRLEYGKAVAEKILTKSGCDPYSIGWGKPILAHPSATVPVGKLLDSDLQTSIKNLYCCDASVFPASPGVPPVLTIVSLGKRLAKHLDTMIPA